MKTLLNPLLNPLLNRIDKLETEINKQNLIIELLKNNNDSINDRIKENYLSLDERVKSNKLLIDKLSEFNEIEDNTLNNIFEYKTQNSEDFWTNKMTLGHKDINKKINKELINEN